MHAASIFQIEVEQAGGVERISLYVDSKIQPKKIFTLQKPHRLVIDFQKLRKYRDLNLPKNYNGALIKAMRFGQFNADTSRLVIDLNKEINVLKKLAVYGDNPKEWRLVVDIEGANMPAVQSAGQPYIVPDLKSKNIAKEAAKPIIVIDPGHGGKDPGAVGRVKEKNITLGYALALRKALLRTGKYRVVLTRERDEFILLHERVAKARNANGDVFVSLHADSNPNPKTEGFSVYTLSEEASDSEAAALAEQENKADIINGVDLSEQEDAVADILIDLAQRETRNKSSELAELMISSMHRKVPLVTNTHRYAGFRVLKAPDIPSVLVEIGFISSIRDERRIQTREYRELIVAGIVKALNRYFESGV